ncbi:MAG: NapC/NirT family cytochrome c, partial [Tropicimonas sp.]|uniref:NapC/NirT family cytochrome c n=1 Tax=Tropicimonas sp. TaxID=2067044 RepID=UPI003A875A88
MKRVWHWLTTPSGLLSSGFLLLAGIIGGAVLTIGGLGASKYMESTEFCVSCHEMRDNLYDDYAKSAHFSNASGVQAGCADCHVPEPLIPWAIDHFQALGELYHSFTG